MPVEPIEPDDGTELIAPVLPTLPTLDLGGYKDELNLAEFPIAALTDRVPDGQMTLVFEDQLDRRDGPPIVRRLTVSASAKHGLPTAVDDEVIVGLIQLTKRRNNFTDPKAFEPSVVVDIDASADKKWACITAMPSQFGDADSWQGRTRPDVPKDDAKRPAYLLELAKQRSAAVADQYRAQLIARYGQERGSKVKYAEAFQLNQYGRQVKVEALGEMFPK